MKGLILFEVFTLLAPITAYSREVDSSAPVKSHVAAPVADVECMKYEDGVSGQCKGNFDALRESGNSSNFASFNYSNYTAVGTEAYSFQAMWDGVWYACIPNNTLKPAWSLAMNASGYFFIEWNSSQICQKIILRTGSK